MASAKDMGIESTYAVDEVFDWYEINDEGNFPNDTVNNSSESPPSEKDEGANDNSDIQAQQQDSNAASSLVIGKKQEFIQNIPIINVSHSEEVVDTSKQVVGIEPTSAPADPETSSGSSPSCSKEEWNNQKELGNGKWKGEKKSTEAKQKKKPKMHESDDTSDPKVIRAKKARENRLQKGKEKAEREQEIQTLKEDCHRLKEEINTCQQTITSQNQKIIEMQHSMNKLQAEKNVLAAKQKEMKQKIKILKEKSATLKRMESFQRNAIASQLANSELEIIIQPRRGVKRELTDDDSIQPSLPALRFRATLCLLDEAE